MTWATTAYWVIGSIAVDTAVRSADSSRKAMHTQADISRQNATIAVQQSSVNEDAQRRRGAIAIGRGAAAAAEGSGLQGTNLDVIQQSAVDAETDALNIRYAGKLGQTSDITQAGFDDSGADSAQASGYLNAGAAALSSYGSYTNSNRKIVKAGG